MSIKNKSIDKLLKGCKGVVISEGEGFGNKGDEYIISAINYIRTHNIPLICIGSGMQFMCIEFARNVLGMKEANSAEFSKSNNIIHKIQNKALLGDYECKIKPKTIASRLYNGNTIKQRHSNIFGLIDKKLINRFIENGLNISMTCSIKNITLTEFIENDKANCYLGCQFHPEYHSKPKNVDPLFIYFVKKCACK